MEYLGIPGHSRYPTNTTETEYLAKIVEYYGILLNTFTKCGTKKQ